MTAPHGPAGTGIAGAMDYRPAGQPQAEACFICAAPLRGGAGHAARIIFPHGIVQVCSAGCAADPRFAKPRHRSPKG